MVRPGRHLEVKMELVLLEFGENDCNYLSVGHEIDAMDHETHEWNWLSIKLLLKFFGLWVYVIGLEIGSEMVSFGVLNFFVALKFREESR